jgi:hypothetical protein
LQFLAGFEAHGLPWRNAYFGACPGITADSGLAGSHIKDTKTAKFNAVVSGQSLLHGFEDGLDRDFRFGFGDAGAVYDVVNDIELYQTNLLKMQLSILETGFAVVKNILLHYDEANYQVVAATLSVSRRTMTMWKPLELWSVSRRMKSPLHRPDRVVHDPDRGR